MQLSKWPAHFVPPAWVNNHGELLAEGEIAAIARSYRQLLSRAVILPMLSSNSPRPPAVVSSNSADEKGGGKRKRRPAGTPDPEAEVVSLSPRTLLEAERHVCEICGQGFQREQNLQMHRRRHKVAWKLAKRRPGTEERSGGGCSGNSSGSTKRVFVCPEANCLHHDPRHALGDLVGIKKHFRRKHSGVRQWACARCGKAYAVQSDYKAHLKTCGTRGHSCDCGRVFSRVESFIEHQDSCHASRAGFTGGTTQPPPAVASSSTAAALSNAATIPSMGADGGTKLTTNYAAFPSLAGCTPARHQCHGGNLELQLLPLAIAPNHSGKATTTTSSLSRPDSDDDDAYQETTKLQLSIGRGDDGTLSPARESIKRSSGGSDEPQEQLFAAAKARQDAVEQLELAEQEFANAKRIRQQAQAELQNACIFRDQSKRQISLMLLQITCNPCRMKHLLSAASKKSSLETASHASSSVTGISNGEADVIWQIKI